MANIELAAAKRELERLVSIEIKAVKEKLADRNVTAVAENTGVHANTIRAIKNGKNTNPTFEVIKKLSDYLEA